MRQDHYLPDPASIAAGEHQIYRYTLVRGETLSLSLTSRTGDGDLVVWRPRDSMPLVVSAATSASAAATITAMSSGTYQIEMISVSAATYQRVLTATHNAHYRT
ncbi:MAG: hypothetical protein ABIV47_28060 [Roseiflexaceae bacterium]